VKKFNKFCCFIVIAFCLSSCSSPVLPDKPTALPNIILISLDACRSDYIGCYGHTNDTSPFLDEVAGKGILFSNAFVNTHGTTPSHTTILTSLYQETHRVEFSSKIGPISERRPIPLEAKQIQEILQSNGYLTIGVTGGGNMNGRLGFNRGFDDFYDQPMSIEKQSAKLLELVDKHNDGNKPVFMFFHTYEVHSPYKAPLEYRNQFTKHESNFDPTSENLLKVANTSSVLSLEDLAYIREQYEAEIKYTDDTLRNMLTELGKRKLMDNAMVVIMADHGEEFAEHGGMLHRGNLYEELLHIPLIIWGSQVESGKKDRRIVSCIDIAPTILTAARIAVPDEMMGRNLLGSEKKLDSEGEEVVFSQFRNEKYSARTLEWKLICSRNFSRRELYNLLEDSAEMDNRAAKNKPVADYLEREIKEWLKGLPRLNDSEKVITVNKREQQQLKALGYVE